MLTIKNKILQTIQVSFLAAICLAAIFIPSKVLASKTGSNRISCPGSQRLVVVNNDDPNRFIDADTDSAGEFKCDGGGAPVLTASNGSVVELTCSGSQTPLFSLHPVPGDKIHAIAGCERETLEEIKVNGTSVKASLNSGGGGDGTFAGSGSAKKADEDCHPDGGRLDAGNCQIIKYITDGIKILSAAVGIVVVIMIAVGGVQYSSARDNPQAVAAAKGRIINAILALVAYLFMFSLLQYLIPGGVI